MLTPPLQLPPFKLHHADTFLRRLRGLLFRPPLSTREGLWIRPCNSVHTLFMRHAIDVVFIDRSLRVLRVVEALHPWRAAWAPGAASVLELRAGAARQLGLLAGQTLEPLLRIERETQA